MVLSGVTGRNGGGDGGSYADRSWWFFLSSPLLCFSFGFGFFLFFHSPYTLKIPRFVRLFHTKNSPLFLSFSLPKIPPEYVVCFSPSPKFPPPCFLFFPPVFIGSRRRGSPYPVQVQGMVAWDGSCAAVAGHGLPLPSSWWQGMRVWVVSVSGQVGWKERAGKKHFKNLLLPCLCILQGRRSSTVLF